MKKIDIDPKYVFSSNTFPPLDAASIEGFYGALRQYLRTNDAPNGQYAIGTPDCDERLCFHLDGLFWAIYYSERGVRTSPVFFDSNTEAAHYLIWKLLSNDGETSEFVSPIYVDSAATPS